jgi:hypothetical protein
MSAFDELKNKASELADSAKEGLEKVSDVAIEKVGDAADALTGGKHSDKIDAAQAKADDVIGGKDEQV